VLFRSSVTATDTWANGLEARVEEIIRKSPLKGTDFGLVVSDTTTGRTIFEHHSDAPLMPASNQKLFVMAAAVDILGPSFEFRTVLGLYRGDLVIIGEGDPAIGDPRLGQRDGTTITATFERWAKALKGTGRTVIAGDVVIDESIFDEQLYHPQWEPQDLDKWYGAPVGALNLNDNCIELTVWPGESAGRPPRWNVTPPSSLVQVVNRAVSAADGVPVIARPTPTFEFILTGQCGTRAELKSVAVPDPGLFFADVCKGVLARQGVTVQGRIRRSRIRQADGTLPVGLEVVATHRTPLEDVLSRVGKNSQNLFAECLLKRLGYEHARRSGAPHPVGSWKNGAAAVESFLTGQGIDTQGLVVSDGSGLSRENRATAGQLAAVLVHMNRHPQRDLFVRSLAVAGEEGSLKGRMKDLRGRVSGKTGTSRQVKSLSGYINGPNGRSYVFSMIVNGYRGSSAPYKRLQDDICRALASWSGS